MSGVKWIWSTATDRVSADCPEFPALCAMLQAPESFSDADELMRRARDGVGLLCEEGNRNLTTAMRSGAWFATDDEFAKGQAELQKKRTSLAGILLMLYEAAGARGPALTQEQKDHLVASALVLLRARLVTIEDLGKLRAAQAERAAKREREAHESH